MYFLSFSEVGSVGGTGALRDGVEGARADPVAFCCAFCSGWGPRQGPAKTAPEGGSQRARCMHKSLICGMRRRQSLFGAIAVVASRTGGADE